METYPSHESSLPSKLQMFGMRKTGRFDEEATAMTYGTQEDNGVLHFYVFDNDKHEWGMREPVNPTIFELELQELGFTKIAH